LEEALGHKEEEEEEPKTEGRVPLLRASIFFMLKVNLLTERFPWEYWGVLRNAAPQKSGGSPWEF